MTINRKIGQLYELIEKIHGEALKLGVKVQVRADVGAPELLRGAFNGAQGGLEKTNVEVKISRDNETAAHVLPDFAGIAQESEKE